MTTYAIAWMLEPFGSPPSLNYKVNCSAHKIILIHVCQNSIVLAVPTHVNRIYNEPARKCHCPCNYLPTVKQVDGFSSEIAFSTDKNHCVEAIKYVTLLLGKILSPVGPKYSLSPPKVQVLYFSNVNTLLEAVYLPFSHQNEGYPNVFKISAMT